MNYYVIFRFNKKDFIKRYLQKDDKFLTKEDGFLTAKKFFQESAANAKRDELSKKDGQNFFFVTGVKIG